MTKRKLNTYLDKSNKPPKKSRSLDDILVDQFWKKMDQLSEWKGNDLLINARVYDSALTIQEFLTN